VVDCFARFTPASIHTLDFVADMAFMLGPKFAQHERDGMDLRRYYFISQAEHAQNIIFKRNHRTGRAPDHSMS